MPTCLFDMYPKVHAPIFIRTRNTQENQHQINSNTIALIRAHRSFGEAGRGKKIGVYTY